ncbi:Probable protein S-acyltransferase 16 [Linum perenne]
MKRRPRFSLPVIVVLLVITFIYFATVFVFVDRWFGLMSSPGLMNAAVFTAVAIMCIFNYCAATMTDPGRVPSTYLPDIEDADNPIHEIKRKGGDLRYCQKCSHYKPPRAHHCRVCKRCVLRMDHHCIWINNCVGHANYKVFFIFVVYAVTACIYSMVLLVGSLTVDPQRDDQINGGLVRSIYYHEGVRAMLLAEKGGNIHKHPYDIGGFGNLTAILGPNIFCWLFPSTRHIGSGLHFHTAYDNLKTRASTK